MNDLYRCSIEIILENQANNGGYLACPNFNNYHYCWFRDGSFTAYAMDLAGRNESAHRFHQWAANKINERAELIRQSLNKMRQGILPGKAEILNTRYRIDSNENETDDWPNFQLDGFGTWLWALNEHRMSSYQGALPREFISAADLVAEYLEKLWSQPCYDCWEEFPDHLHPYTLAAIYGGLKSHEYLSGKAHHVTTNTIRDILIGNAERYGYFVKFADSPEVDASLLGLSVPYRVVSSDDPAMLRTVEYIEKSILRDNGLHRYQEDTYYGGGAWILLTAWLGWYYCELAAQRPDLSPVLREKIQACKTWIESHAEHVPNLNWLPEQVSENLNNPAFYPFWVDRWGKIASPLLWSHATYIILHNKLSESKI